MSERLPVVSGAQLVGALGKLGWTAVRQRGSHVRLKHPDRSVSLVVPLHRELKRGTLAGSCATQASTAKSFDASSEASGCEGRGFGSAVAGNEAQCSA